MLHNDLEPGGYLLWEDLEMKTNQVISPNPTLSTTHATEIRQLMERMFASHGMVLWYVP